MIALISCNRVIPFADQYITPAFVGFNLSDLDTLVVREYKKDDSFHNVLDSAVIITNRDVLASNSSSETTVVVFNHISGEAKYIFPDHDWQIYIPAQNRVISMSKFDSPRTNENCTSGGDLCPGCTNPIRSFLQNGQETVPQYGTVENWGSIYLTYIHH